MADEQVSDLVFVVKNNKRRERITAIDNEIDENFVKQSELRLMNDYL